MALTSSMEDYLEAVFILQQKCSSVRSVDIAVHLGVTKPSVSRAVKELSKMGYLLKEADGTLSLTQNGQKIAKQVYEKHLFFTKQLIEAGVPEDIAKKDACKLEHVISEESFAKLKSLFQDCYLRLFPTLQKKTHLNRVKEPTDYSIDSFALHMPFAVPSIIMSSLSSKVSRMESICRRKDVFSACPSVNRY